MIKIFFKNSSTHQRKSLKETKSKNSSWSNFYFFYNTAKNRVKNLNEQKILKVMSKIVQHSRDIVTFLIAFLWLALIFTEIIDFFIVHSRLVEKISATGNTQGLGFALLWSVLIWVLKSYCSLLWEMWWLRHWDWRWFENREM